MDALHLPFLAVFVCMMYDFFYLFVRCDACICACFNADLNVFWLLQNFMGLLWDFGCKSTVLLKSGMFTSYSILIDVQLTCTQ